MTEGVQLRLEAEQREPEPDLIERVAMRDANGRLYSMLRPMRHGDIIHAMRANGMSVGEIAECEQGFMTTNGIYLNRVEAKTYANDNDQPLRERPDDAGPENTTEAFSEDFW
jgi:hypothetical protein